MKFYSVAVIAFVGGLSTFVATAAKAQLMVTRPCLVENAQVTINFSGMDTSVVAARAKLDGKIGEIKELGQTQPFTKFVMQSQSYNLSANYNGGNGGEQRYQYNATVSFMIQPSEKAVDFMQLLAKKGYQTSVNVNSYNNGSCGSTNRE